MSAPTQLSPRFEWNSGDVEFDDPEEKSGTWEDDQHPRNANGEFTSAGGGTAHSFASDAEGYRWLDAMLARSIPDPKDVPPDELHAAEHYKWSSFMGINSLLRGHRKGGGYDDEIAALDRYINRGTVDRDVVVHRAVFAAGLTNDREAVNKFNQELLDHKGGVFVDRGYVSTTVHNREDLRNNQFIPGYVDIVVPKGSHAMPLDQFMGVMTSPDGKGKPREGELLLPRGTQFWIKEASRDPASGQVQATLEVIPSGSPKETDAWRHRNDKSGTTEGAVKGWETRRSGQLTLPINESGVPSQRWYDQTRAVLRSDLNDDDGKALMSYCSASFEWINASIRMPGPVNKVNGVVRQLDRAFKRVRPLNSDVLMRRGMRVSGATLGLRKGGVFIDRGFVSTTLSASLARTFSRNELRPSQRLLVTIRIPKGSRVLPGSWSEGELILPRNSKFKVLDYDAKQRRARLELIND